MREKLSIQPPSAPTASTTGPCPTVIKVSRTPQHWKFTQHLCATRPPPNCPNSIPAPLPLNQRKQNLRTYLHPKVYDYILGRATKLNGHGDSVVLWLTLKSLSTYSRLSLSRSRRDPLKHFEISALRHIRCAELSKIPIEQPNLSNENVI